MNKRERVLMAIRHQQPDHVPYVFHGSGTVYAHLRAHYGFANNQTLVDFIGNHIVKIGSDFNVNPWAPGIRMENMPSGGPVTTAVDHIGGLHTDEFGCLWDRSGGLPFPVGFPLGNDPAGLDNYRMPDPYLHGRFDAAAQVVAANRGKVFLFGKLGMALFERAWAIRGMEQIMMDMVERPQFVDELLDRILYEWNLPIINQQIALGIDAFYFADDWGAQAGLLFHPRMWRKFIKPRMAVCYQRVKEKGLFVGQHSDGNVVDILPDLIEIGLDIFNPVDPTVYDPYSLKARFGDQLSFYGGINVKQTLPFGTPEEVRAEMLERCQRMGAGGGYMLQSSHTMLDDIPLENLIAYVETCHMIAGIDTQAEAVRLREQSI